MNHNLEELIEEELQSIVSIAERLPGVVVVHDIRDMSIVWMSKSGLDLLGISLEEVKKITSEEYHARFFNFEDAQDYIPKIISLLQRNNEGENATYFQQVKFKAQSDWTWHMTSTRVFLKDPQGQPLLILSMAFPIDAMHQMTAKASRLLEENNFLRKNLKKYSRLSKREKEILRQLALGKSSAETAAELFISTNTVDTHKKNIRQKLDTSSFYELCQYARAFDLI